MKFRGVSLARMETVNTPLSVMNSCVRFPLLTQTEMVGGSDEVWMTVLAICPLNLSPLREQMMYRP